MCVMRAASFTLQIVKVRNVCYACSIVYTSNSKGKKCVLCVQHRFKTEKYCKHPCLITIVFIGSCGARTRESLPALAQVNSKNEVKHRNRGRRQAETRNVKKW